MSLAKLTPPGLARLILKDMAEFEAQIRGKLGPDFPIQTLPGLAPLYPGSGGDH